MSDPTIQGGCAGAFCDSNLCERCMSAIQAKQADPKVADLLSTIESLRPYVLPLEIVAAVEEYEASYIAECLDSSHVPGSKPSYRRGVAITRLCLIVQKRAELKMSLAGASPT